MTSDHHNPALPIRAVLADLKEGLAANCPIILSAPTGSGKTTGVPPALLDAPWLEGRKIIMLEPRRLAARMAAARMADLLGEEVGQRVGYRIRLESKITAATRIEVVTEGILTRILQNDPELTQYGMVIFDEFHERSIHADLALALCLDSRAGLRDDLRLLIMSATLDVQGLAGIIPDARLVTGTGRSFPVEIRYLDQRRSEPALTGQYQGRATVAQMITAITQTVSEQQGDILAFLPGGWEIDQTAQGLAALAAKGIKVMPLHGSLPKKVQDHAVMPSPGSRKIVLATPIAETSLTIEGVTTVIDAGWARQPKFDANSGLGRLETRRISRASAEQRAGRAGRLGPGVCYRLWNIGVQHSMLAHTPPEIMETDLGRFALELALWGINDPQKLAWIDPPPAGHYQQARQLLRDLGLLDDHGRLNKNGKQLAQLPLHPRLGRMVLKSVELGAPNLGCDLAALLAERDILSRTSSVDLDRRLAALNAVRAGDRKTLQQLGADADAGRRIDQAAAQLKQALSAPRQHKKDVSPGNLLACSYPDRIAQRRDGSRENYLLANGRGAALPSGDLLGGSDYLVIAHLDVSRAEGKIFLAAHLDLADIETFHAELLQENDHIGWDQTTNDVLARREKRLGAILLSNRRLTNPDPEKIKAALLEGIRRLGISCLPWNDKARELQARLLSLKTWEPEGTWPDLTDETLASTLHQWLGPHLDGLKKRAHLERLNLSEILLDPLDWQMRTRLDKEAPTHITAPSGSRIKLDYQPGGPPVMAVRLQEMFGLADTPKVCNNKAPVLLHLLSPARRPMQVTQDLRGFWNTTYPEVKKELKGRYPKHHWPEDPWSALPTARVKRKK